MAPLTRHGSSVARNAAPAPETNGHLASSATQNVTAYEQNSTVIDDIDPADLMSPSLLGPERFEEAFHPLRAAADRVGREVEKFSEQLDRLDPRKHGRSSWERYEAAFGLADEYHAIAEAAAERLHKKHARQRQTQLHDRWRQKIDGLKAGANSDLAETLEDPDDEDDASSSISASQTTVKDLKHWEQEEQTWSLFRDMLQVQHTNPRLDIEQEKQRELAAIGNVNRFSSEQKIWDSFMVENDLARERQVVLSWLKDTAESSGKDVDILVEQLEGGADRGKGLWAHGWLYTKEAIKAQKRLRSWPRPIEPTSPGISASLLNADKTEALASQLDPDAALRQKHVVEREDEYYERATWLACWEMLRRGKSWEDIREWCQDRVEQWRAVSLRGSVPAWDEGLDDDQGHEAMRDDDDGDAQQRPRIYGNRTRALWRRMCYTLSQDGGMDDYERAVYGVQGGDLPSVLKVCRSFDDVVFAHYNALLLSQFDAYLQTHHPDRLSAALASKFKVFNALQFHGEPSAADRTGRTIIDSIRSNPATQKESARPMKMVQGVLIGKTFLDFVRRLGWHISKIANERKVSEIIPPLEQGWREEDEEEEVSADLSIGLDDFDSLRVITHMLFIYQDLGLDIGYGDDKVAIENVIVAYIDFLKLAGKLSMVPLYASHLSPERQLMTLGRVLLDETAAPRRKELIRLMYGYEIDVPKVVEMQMEYILKEVGDSPSASVQHDTTGMLKAAESGSAIRSMSSNFLDGEISDEDDRLIRSFEWFLELEGQWKSTFDMGTYVYKRFFALRHLSAARELYSLMSSSRISTTKTKTILGHPLDITKPLPDFDEEAAPPASPRATHSLRQQAQEQWSSRSAASEQRKTQVEVLCAQARVFVGLEQLIEALVALEEWQIIHDEAPAKSELTAARHWKHELTTAFDDVEQAMSPLLHGWLTDVAAEHAADIAAIRALYLPEAILAYNAVIVFMGAITSSAFLLSSMDLSTVVAAPDSDLLPCFVARGLLPDLMKSFAAASRTMVSASKGAGKGRAKKKSKTGESVALWQIKP